MYATSPFFLTIACVSFIVGAIGGLYQIKLKRLLVYSMIYNNGYFLLILAIPSLFNLMALFYFLVIYLLNLLGLFLCILALRSSITSKQLTSIYSLVNIFRVNPILAFSIIFLLFSLSGIPPLIGFFGKFYILFWSFNNLFFFVLCLSLFTSIINIFYYIRLIKIIAFIKTKNIIFIEPLSHTLGIILFIILFLISCILLIPSLFFNNFKI
jgi:NADH:ubiquinone oxidoreductase subunit 2 (subunit N)